MVVGNKKTNSKTTAFLPCFPRLNSTPSFRSPSRLFMTAGRAQPPQQGNEWCERVGRWWVHGQPSSFSLLHLSSRIFPLPQVGSPWGISAPPWGSCASSSSSDLGAPSAASPFCSPLFPLWCFLLFLKGTFPEVPPVWLRASAVPRGGSARASSPHTGQPRPLPTEVPLEPPLPAVGTCTPHRAVVHFL